MPGVWQPETQKTAVSVILSFRRIRTKYARAWRYGLLWNSPWLCRVRRTWKLLRETADLTPFLSRPHIS